MRGLLHAMRFTGHAALVGAVGNVLGAATSALSSTLTSHVGPDGLTVVMTPAPAG